MNTHPNFVIIHHSSVALEYAVSMVATYYSRDCTVLMLRPL